MEQLKNESYENLHMVLGMVTDKDLNSIIGLFPNKASYYFCKPKVLRGMDADILRSYFEDNGLIGNTYLSTKSALDAAKGKAIESDLIYVGGSTFVVAEII